MKIVISTFLVTLAVILYLFTGEGGYELVRTPEGVFLTQRYISPDLVENIECYTPDLVNVEAVTFISIYIDKENRLRKIEKVETGGCTDNRYDFYYWIVDIPSKKEGCFYCYTIKDEEIIEVLKEYRDIGGRNWRLKKNETTVSGINSRDGFLFGYEYAIFFI